VPRWSALGEEGLLRRIRRHFPAPARDVLVPLGDDAALIRLAPRDDLVLTTDQLVEGIHFRRSTHPPGLLGARALTVKEDGGTARTIATVAAHQNHATPNFLFDTVASVQTKAQAWFAANDTKMNNDLVAFSHTLHAPSFHMAGCAWYHPKYDSGHTPNTTFYAGYPTARITVGVAPNTQQVHPDHAWGGVDGVNQGHLSCVFKNMGAGNAVVVARHEIGHSSDHTPYDAGPGDDHCPQSRTTCLMNWESEHLTFCTAGTDHSLKKTKGWNPP